MDREKLWGRDPDWWNAVASLLQLVVLGVAVGLVNFFIGWHEKRLADAEQLASLEAQLENQSPQEYQVGLQKLLISTGGPPVIDGYIKRNSNLCAPWPKTNFLVSRIQQTKISTDEETDLLRFALSSWGCHSHSLVRDAQMYELIKSQPACDMLASEKFVIPPLSLMRMAALLATLSSACPQMIQNSDLYKSLYAQFSSNGAGNTLTLVLPLPFTVFPEPAEGPVDPQVMMDLAFNVKVLFLKLGKNGLGVMWNQVATEPELERIIFGWQLLKAAEFDAKLRVSAEKEVRSWVTEGLHNEDRQTRYAAIQAIVRFQWAEYDPLLKNVAEHDSDATVRKAAMDAVDTLQKARLAGGAHDTGAASP